MIKNSLNKVILVNADDQYVGEMDKYKAHEHFSKLHRASSVWLVNSKKQVLLQKRSDQKIVGAGWWGNAVCGNVRPGESYEDCAVRRLKEEIGVVGSELFEDKNSATDADVNLISISGVRKESNLKLEAIYKFTYKAYCNEKYGEREVDQVFIGKYDGEVVLNNSEVSEVAWVDLNDLIKQVGEQKITPKETLKMSLKQLKKYTIPVEIDINGKKYLLAPWTWMMLADKRLVEKLKNIS